MKKVFVAGMLSMAVLLSGCGIKASNGGSQDQADKENTTITTQEDVVLEDSEEVTEAPSTETQEKLNADVVKLNPNEPIDYEGSSLNISIPDADENGGGVVVLSYGAQSVEVSDYAEWLTSSYVIPMTDGEFNVLVQTCHSNDWVISYLVNVKADGMTVEQEITGGVNDDSEVSKDSISVHSRANIFGTYSTTLEYKLENNKFVNDSNYTAFYNVEDSSFWDTLSDADDEQIEYLKTLYAEDGKRILVLKQELVASDENGAEWKLPAGSVIYPEGYQENERTFYFSMDGKKGSFVYEDADDGYSHTVNGVGENELFENLMYAG